jgi:hypothetical protein
MQLTLCKMIVARNRGVVHAILPPEAMMRELQAAG